MEYYEGRGLRGAVVLTRPARAAVISRWDRTFQIATPTRTWALRIDPDNATDAAEAWVAAINDIIQLCPDIDE